MNFVKDCLDRNLSLKDVATKHNIPMDAIFDVYEEKRNYITLLRYKTS